MKLLHPSMVTVAGYAVANRPALVLFEVDEEKKEMSEFEPSEFEPSNLSWYGTARRNSLARERLASELKS